MLYIQKRSEIHKLYGKTVWFSSHKNALYTLNFFSLKIPVLIALVYKALTFFASSQASTAGLAGHEQQKPKCFIYKTPKMRSIQLFFPARTDLIYKAFIQYFFYKIQPKITVKCCKF